MANKKADAPNRKIRPIRLPGKGKIDPKLIRDAVRKAREQRLAKDRETAAAS